MNKYYFSLLTVFIVLAMPQTNAASLNGAMQECAKIKRDLKRLACFDKLSGNVTDYEVEALSEAQQTVVADSNIAAQQTQPIADGGGSPADQFGLEEKTAAEALDSIRSTIPGKFIGLRKDDEFTLANGQVWKVTDSGRIFRNTTNPTVEITRGMFGSYRIKVAEINRTLSVKRIK